MGCGAFCSHCGRCGRKVTDTIKWRVCRYCDFKNSFEATRCANCGMELPTCPSTIPAPPFPPPPGQTGGLRSAHHMAGS